MSVRECPREREVVEAVVRTGCRAGLGEALQLHLVECASCRELTSLVEGIQADQASATRAHQLPTASQVWWRARVRARLEAAHSVDRPIGVVQQVTAAALVGLAASLVGLGPIVDAVTWFGDAAARIPVEDVAGMLAAALQASPIRLTMVAAVGCLAIVIPIAALVALSRD